jgi:hypothetical protein
MGRPHVRFGPILSKNDFRRWSEEDFRRITTQQGILIQELGLSDSEILHFLQSSGMPTTFSTASVKSGHQHASRDVRFTPESGHWLSVSECHFVPKGN